MLTVSNSQSTEVEAHNQQWQPAQTKIIPFSSTRTFFIHAMVCSSKAAVSITWTVRVFGHAHLGVPGCVAPREVVFFAGPQMMLQSSVSWQRQRKTSERALRQWALFSATFWHLKTRKMLGHQQVRVAVQLLMKARVTLSSVVARVVSGLVYLHHFHKGWVGRGGINGGQLYGIGGYGSGKLSLGCLTQRSSQQNPNSQHHPP
jgi:hypothetical protein